MQLFSLFALSFCLFVFLGGLFLYLYYLHFVALLLRLYFALAFAMFCSHFSSVARARDTMWYVANEIKCCHDASPLCTCNNARFRASTSKYMFTSMYIYIYICVFNVFMRALCTHVTLFCCKCKCVNLVARNCALHLCVGVSIHLHL